jgi:hypothetical protein
MASTTVQPQTMRFSTAQFLTSRSLGDDPAEAEQRALQAAESRALRTLLKAFLDEVEQAPRSGRRCTLMPTGRSTSSLIGRGHRLNWMILSRSASTAISSGASSIRHRSQQISPPSSWRSTTGCPPLSRRTAVVGGTHPNGSRSGSMANCCTGCERAIRLILATSRRSGGTGYESHAFHQAMSLVSARLPGVWRRPILLPIPCFSL